MDRMILHEIVLHKREEVEERQRRHPLHDLKSACSDLDQKPSDFKGAISSLPINLIAELKKASPSRGSFFPGPFEPQALAKELVEAGASALSILTDERFFQGNDSYLSQVRRVTEAPLLRKEFILDEYQIYEARLLGADAVLLIASILSPAQLKDFVSLIEGKLSMTALVETHNREELEKALLSQASCIGVNNRDLKTFRCDLNTTLSLAPLIPSEKVLVSESGIFTREDVLFLQRAGVKAILVGEALMKSKNRADKVRELLGYDQS